MSVKRSDTLIVTFDDSGYDKSCLLVGRFNPGGATHILRTFYDNDAEHLYEQLSDNRMLYQRRNVPDFIDELIDGMNDSIDDYTSTLKNTSSLVDEMKLKGRIDELKAWRKSLKQLKEEYSE